MSRPLPPRMSRADLLLLLLLSSIWGGSFLYFKILVAELPPMTVVLGRCGMAALALGLLGALRGEFKGMRRADLAAFAVTGLLSSALPFCLIAWGETRIPSGLAAIINATTPIFTVLVAHVWTLDERLSPSRVAGVTLGFLGVALAVGVGLDRFDAALLVGVAACVLSAMSYGVAAVYARRFNGLPPVRIGACQLATATLWLAIPVAVVDKPWTLPMPSAQAWAAWFAIALLSSALAYVLFYRLLARVGSTNASLCTLLAPVMAVLLGAAVLHEPLRPQALLGMALVALGIVVLDGRIVPAPLRSRRV